MKIKTQDLIGPPLDWVVSIALGQTPSWDAETKRVWLSAPQEFMASPSTSGDTVLEIMELEKISALNWANGWKACYAFDTEEFGPTLRIAVCRCFVASKLGDEVDVPEELMK